MGTAAVRDLHPTDSETRYTRQAFVPTAVVFDANIYVSDFWMGGAEMQLALEAFERLDYIRVLPEITAREVVGRFSHSVRESLRKLKSASADLRRIGVDSSIDEKRLGKEADDRIESYSQFIRASTGLVFLEPIPEVSHESLVDRAIGRRRPFSDGGSGYRDAILWNTILSIAKTRRVILVSADSRAFHEKDGGPNVARLHPELVDDLIQANMPKDQVILCGGLPQFNEAFVKPKLKMIADIVNEVNESKFLNYFDEDKVSELLIEQIPEHREDLEFMESASLGKLLEVKAIEAYLLDEDKAWLLCEAKAKFIITGWLDKFVFPNGRTGFAMTGHRNGPLMLVNGEPKASIQFSISYELSTRIVNSVTIDEIYDVEVAH
jgi:hypothetical protein